MAASILRRQRDVYRRLQRGGLCDTAPINIRPAVGRTATSANIVTVKVTTCSDGHCGGWARGRPTWNRDQSARSSARLPSCRRWTRAVRVARATLGAPRRQVDLDQHALTEPSHADAGTRRPAAGHEVAGAGCVHRVVVALDVQKVDANRHDLRKIEPQPSSTVRRLSITWCACAPIPSG